MGVAGVVRNIVFATIAALSATAAAASPSAGDSAALRVYARSAEMNWYGVGTAVASVNLCVVSTTGRFRLEITSARGGALTGPGALAYQVTFRDGAGAESTDTTEGRSILSFEGSARPAADCSAGPNAQLRLRVPEGQLIQGVAGSYFDELQFAVVPL
jgi:hypothetical protein